MCLWDGGWGAGGGARGGGVCGLGDEECGGGRGRGRGVTNTGMSSLYGEDGDG